MLPSLFGAWLMLSACATDKTSHAAPAAGEPEDQLSASIKPGVQANIVGQLGLAMIDPKNPNPSPGGAFGMLTAACTQGDVPSCRFLQAHFTEPTSLRPVPNQATRPASAEAAAQQGIIQCSVKVDGTLTGCTIVRGGGPRADAFLKACREALYAPGRLDGIGFETTVYLRFDPGG
jgi:hypothetical protein